MIQREPSSELRVVIREWLDEVLLPSQAHSCGDCLEPLGQAFAVWVEAEAIERSVALCERCAAGRPPAPWSFPMPNPPS